MTLWQVIARVNNEFRQLPTELIDDFTRQRLDEITGSPVVRVGGGRTIVRNFQTSRATTLLEHHPRRTLCHSCWERLSRLRLATVRKLPTISLDYSVSLSETYLETWELFLRWGFLMALASHYDDTSPRVPRNNAMENQFYRRRELPKRESCLKAMSDRLFRRTRRISHFVSRCLLNNEPGNHRIL